ncbi:MAG: indole-3-glycerol phosphate synthase TrpC [Prevotellaceae bacterium]|jgi:indole-3-glycerol phosphate synthase|nr:indole-3-glycerol phosphate synthase TrpC [Prevotellaceae bacterium]
MGILHEIIENKRQEVHRQKEALPVSELERIIAENNCEKRSFKQALLNSSTGIIAEFKRKSPSKGWIAKEAMAAKIVSDYATYGATAISVLTDEHYFGGSFDDFDVARKSLNIPMLRKDFIVDSYQIYQSKVLCADIILLIAAALSPAQTAGYALRAHELGLEVLLEIHDETELEHISENIDIVGINNRNLSTFITDVRHSFELGEKIPKEYVKISESGISDVATVKSLRQAGFRGFLMGETFMKTPSPGEALRDFVEQLEKY